MVIILNAEENEAKALKKVKLSLSNTILKTSTTLEQTESGIYWNNNMHATGLFSEFHKLNVSVGSICWCLAFATYSFPLNFKYIHKYHAVYGAPCNSTSPISLSLNRWAWFKMSQWLSTVRTCELGIITCNSIEYTFISCIFSFFFYSFLVFLFVLFSVKNNDELMK